MSEVQKSTVYQKFSNGFKELCKNTRHIFSIRFSVFEMKIKFRKYSKKWSFWVFTIFENCQKSVDLSLFIKWKKLLESLITQVKKLEEHLTDTIFNSWSVWKRILSSTILRHTLLRNILLGASCRIA